MFSLTPNFEQISFIEQIKQVGELPSRNPLNFLQLLNEHIDLPTLIPGSFYSVYYGFCSRCKPYEQVQNDF